MTFSRRHALALLASVPVIAGTRPARGATPDEPTPPTDPSTRTVALSGSGRVHTVRAEAPFALVGLTWSGSVPDVAELRVRRDGGWSDWLPVDTTHADDSGVGDPVWTGRASTVQVRALRDGKPADGVSAVLIDPGRHPSDATPRTTTVGGLEVVSRSEWGADESLGGGCGLPEYAEPVRAIAVHHTAETNDYEPEDSASIVRGIHTFHAQTRGWCDIGYHALVDRFGRIFEGRAGGLDRAVVGAHAAGFNRHTSGVAMMGTFTDQDPPRAMQYALTSFVNWKTEQHGIDPEAETELTSAGGGTSRHPKGKKVRLPTVFGHRDVDHTSCPGDAGYDLLPDLREITHAILPFSD